MHDTNETLYSLFGFQYALPAGIIPVGHIVTDRGWVVPAPATARDLRDAVQQSTAELRQEVQQLRSEVMAARPAPAPVLLTLSHAAKRLGISRNAHGLKALIASGRIKTVTLNRRVRIPAAELDRVVVDDGGEVSVKTEKRPRRGAPLGADSAAAIAKLKL